MVIHVFVSVAEGPTSRHEPLMSPPPLSCRAAVDLALLMVASSEETDAPSLLHFPTCGSWHGVWQTFRPRASCADQ